MKTVTLVTCNNSFEANLLKGKLENESIPSFLTNENFTTLYSNYNGVLGGGIQLMVNDVDFEKAAKIIEEISGNSTNNTEKLICPNCNSKNIKFGLGKKNKIKKLFFVLLSLFLTSPFNNINNSQYCEDCNAEFNL